MYRSRPPVGAAAALLAPALTHQRPRARTDGLRVADLASVLELASLMLVTVGLTWRSVTGRLTNNILYLLNQALYRLRPHSRGVTAGHASRRDRDRDRSMTNAPSPIPRDTRGAHLVTLCRFDELYWPEPLLGPFIPCERRLALLEILEIQGRDFIAGF